MTSFIILLCKRAAKEEGNNKPIPDFDNESNKIKRKNSCRLSAIYPCTPYAHNLSMKNDLKKSASTINSFILKFQLVSVTVLKAKTNASEKNMRVLRYIINK